MEGSSLRPPDGLTPIRPQLRPVGIHQELAARRGEQNCHRPRQTLAGGDVGQLELNGTDLIEIGGQFLCDHLAQVDHPG
ncbi:hypothetical protein [Micromonospora taraxaci]|uniref:hypothetical protein n=1 Tax=Micromonospora taraxaci TaxID=1316803 RepID=UPI0033A7DAF0